MTPCSSPVCFLHVWKLDKMQMAVSSLSNEQREKDKCGGEAVCHSQVSSTCIWPCGSPVSYFDPEPQSPGPNEESMWALNRAHVTGRHESGPGWHHAMWAAVGDDEDDEGAGALAPGSPDSKLL